MAHQETEAAITEVRSAVSEFKNSFDAKFNALQEQADRIETVQNRPNLGGSSNGTHANSAEVKSFFGYLRTGRDFEKKAAMTSGNDTAGGYLVPSQLELQLTKYLRARSSMRQLARVVKVDGAEYKMPRATSGAAYAWTAETASRPETATPNMAMLTIPTHEVYANPCITQNLLDDNVFDLENWLIAEVGEAFGDAEGAAFITGDGVGKPKGLFAYDMASTPDATRGTDAFQYVPSCVPGGVTADSFISLMHAVKPQYRQNASWLMNGEVLEAARKLKDTAGQYLWAPSLQAGQPSTFLGYAVFEDENVPAIGLNSISAAFGDFNRAYTITDRSAAMLRDPFSQKPYVSFYTTKRLGGGAGRDNRAVKFLKLAAS